MQVLTDLLAPERPRLQLREDLRVGVYVEGLTEEPVASAAEAVCALAAGMGRRQVRAAPQQRLPYLLAWDISKNDARRLASQRRSPDVCIGISWLSWQRKFLCPAALSTSLSSLAAR